ncbi:Kinetochore protein [Colletotrichum higginsianum IMI 349063]|uniref:Kinetochore protein n=1 Tax=Colletotrichum higginsianum (strain IMI 349063) TaxID=759273 RepID=A0A1B7Y7C6_COLHI|nr:Kinetochore protein [Colletotrichum higginsianum IMI 349063]OBR07884.1 Kinetochore protein [Colletotrichum higginsianum IMI 349063]
MASTQAPPPTVIAQKQAFLAAQTRLFSQPLRPSRPWLAANEAAESPLPDPVVEHVVARLNTTVLQHSRRAYSHQASRHVAEQIDALYLSQPPAAQDHEPAEGLSLSLDLSTSFSWYPEHAFYQRPPLAARMSDSSTKAEEAAVKSLPPTWPVDHDVTMYPMEAKRYAEQVDRLKSLAELRQQTTARLERLRRMKALLDPFRSDDDGIGVQENLITRDGEVEKEMESMRVLLARVGGRVNLLSASTEPVSPFGEGDPLAVRSVATGEKRKLDDLLNHF